MSFLIGLLMALSAWSVEWALSGRQETTFAFPGAVSRFVLSQPWPDSDGLDRRKALTELEEFLRRNSLSLAVAAWDEGRPMISVLDPNGLVAWFPESAAASRIDDPSVYLFEGSYAHEAWTRGGGLPLGPDGAEVAGVIEPPKGAERLQLAGPLTEQSLAPGDLVVNTVDEGHLSDLGHLMAQLGFEMSDARQVPLVVDLYAHPMFMLTTTFLALGLAVSAVHPFLYFRSRDREWRIRCGYGARPGSLVANQLALTLPVAVIFGALGSAASGLFVRWISNSDLRTSEVEALAVAAGLAGAVTTATWLIAFYLALRVRWRRYVA